MPDAWQLNIEVISKALDQHERNCPFPTEAIEMSGYEVERLGEESVRGVPIRVAEDMGTGRFRIVCPNTRPPEPEELPDAIGSPLETADA